MTAEIKFDGLDRWHTDLVRGPERFKRQARDRVLEPYGQRITNTARGIVPYDRGWLHDSIAYQVRVRPLLMLEITAGGGRVDYAGYVHNGTSQHPPRPFLTNAIDRHQQAMFDELGDLAIEVLK